jgi:dTDP-4-amino-4,6-dideoxygalactose transaminase
VDLAPDCLKKQSFGASYKRKKSYNLSTIGSTSLFLSKSLGFYGDGGELFTNDYELAENVANQCLSLPMSPYLSVHRSKCGD